MTKITEGKSIPEKKRSEKAHSISLLSNDKGLSDPPKTTLSDLTSTFQHPFHTC